MLHYNLTGNKANQSNWHDTDNFELPHILVLLKQRKKEEIHLKSGLKYKQNSAKPHNSFVQRMHLSSIV